MQELRTHLVVPSIETPKPPPKPDVVVGDVVLIGTQLAQWAGCLARVDEVKSWGIKVWVTGPSHPDFPRMAEFPLRLGWDNIDKVFRELREPGHPPRS